MSRFSSFTGSGRARKLLAALLILAAVALAAGGYVLFRNIIGGKFRGSGGGESFVAWYRPDAATGGFQVWRADLDGGNARNWFAMNNTRLYTPENLGPGVSLFAYDPKGNLFYYTYGSEVYRVDSAKKTNAQFGAISGAYVRGIERMWISRDRANALALMMKNPAKPGAQPVPDYVQMNLRTGAQVAISPVDRDWDGYDFQTRPDVCYVDCEGKVFAAKNGNSFKLAKRGGAGAGRWPVLVMSAKGGGEKALTDGSNRLLAARWTSSGKALVFIAAEKCEEAVCRGRVKYADASTGAVADVSETQLTAETIFNVLAGSDAVFYYEYGGAKRGVYMFDFSPGPPKLLDADGAWPKVFE